jgi:hypothetical protein
MYKGQKSKELWERGLRIPPFDLSLFSLCPKRYIFYILLEITHPLIPSFAKRGVHCGQWYFLKYILIKAGFPLARSRERGHGVRASLFAHF